MRHELRIKGASNKKFSFPHTLMKRFLKLIDAGPSLHCRLLDGGIGHPITFFPFRPLGWLTSFRGCLFRGKYALHRVYV